MSPLVTVKVVRAPGLAWLSLVPCALWAAASEATYATKMATVSLLSFTSPKTHRQWGGSSRRIVQLHLHS